MTYRIVKVRDVFVALAFQNSTQTKEPWAVQRQGSSTDLTSQSLFAGTPSERTDGLLTAIGRLGRMLPDGECRS